MEWLAPLKTTLFACKSVSALKEAEAEPDQRPVDGNPADIVAGSGRANLRRRSSLSDLDVLKQKRHALRFSDGAHLTIGDRKSDKLFPGYHSNSRLTECGGSIGDLMNLKHFGSNRSLVSMTSSIADSVPLETVRQRKKTTASSCESNDRCSDPPVASSVATAAITEDADVAILPDDVLVDDDVVAEFGHRRAMSIIDRAKRLSRHIQNCQTRRDSLLTEDSVICRTVTVNAHLAFYLTKQIK